MNALNVAAYPADVLPLSFNSVVPSSSVVERGSSQSQMAV